MFCSVRKRQQHMENYNFWQDFFDTYQSLSDWTKALWLIVPPAFLLGLVALVLRFRLDSKRADHGIDGELIYSIRRDDKNRFHIFRHGPTSEHEPALLLLDHPNSDSVEQQNPNGRP